MALVIQAGVSEPTVNGTEWLALADTLGLPELLVQAVRLMSAIIAKKRLRIFFIRNLTYG